jgi:hypothetical protein
MKREVRSADRQINGIPAISNAQAETQVTGSQRRTYTALFAARTDSNAAVFKVLALQRPEVSDPRSRGTAPD